jgi:hypothetical protein
MVQHSFCYSQIVVCCVDRLNPQSEAEPRLSVMCRLNGSCCALSMISGQTENLGNLYLVAVVLSDLAYTLIR